MVWESMEEKGFISCDNKIGLRKAIPLYLCAGLFDRTDISIDWSPFNSEYMIMMDITLSDIEYMIEYKMTDSQKKYC